MLRLPPYDPSTRPAAPAGRATGSPAAASAERPAGLPARQPVFTRPAGRRTLPPAKLAARSTEESALLRETEGHSAIPVLFRQYRTTHMDFFDRHGRPNLPLMRRAADRFLRDAAGVLRKAAFNVTRDFVISKLQNLLPSPATEQGAQQRAALVDASIFLAHSSGDAHALGLSQMAGLGLAGANAGMRAFGGVDTGAWFTRAEGQMAFAQTMSAMLDIANLLRNLRTTRSDDVRHVHEGFQRLRQDAIDRMPPQRRAGGYDPYEEELKTLLREAGPHLDSGQMKRAWGLLEGMELHVDSFENAIYVPENKWLIDTGDLEGAEAMRSEMQRLARSFEPQSRPQVMSFMLNHVAKTRQDFERTAASLGTDLSFLLITGAPGIGKTWSANAIAATIAESVSHIVYADASRFVGGEGKVDRGNPDPTEDEVSPTRRFGTAKELFKARPGTVFRMDEVDPEGGEGSGPDRTGVDAKRVEEFCRRWEPANFGLSVTRGAFEGSHFFSDLARTSMLGTSNRTPTLGAVSRRLDPALVQTLPEPTRREIVRDTTDKLLQRLAGRYGTSLDAARMFALKAGIASVTKQVINESMKDGDVSNMIGVLRDLIDKLADDYALGRREAPEPPPGAKNPLDHPVMTKFGWDWPDAGEPDPAVTFEVTALFRRKRAANVVGGLVDAAAEALLGLKEGEPLPDVTQYLDMLDKRPRISPRHTVKFISEALDNQWKPYMSGKALDVQRSYSALQAHVKGLIAWLPKTVEAETTRDHGFREAVSNLFMADAIMRMPTRPKNLSQWQRGGDVGHRRRNEDAFERIRSRFTGQPGSGDEVVAFGRQAIDNTIPVSEDLADVKPKRALLHLSGQPGTAPVEQAKKFLRDLGFEPIVLWKAQYFALLQPPPAPGSEDDDMKGSLDVHDVLGRFKPLFTGTHFNGALVIPDADFSDPDECEGFRETLEPDAKNPRVKLLHAQDASVEVPVDAMPVVFVSKKALEDKAMGELMRSEHIEAVSEGDRRADAQKAFSRELALLHVLDIPLHMQIEIADQAAAAMPWALSLNMARHAGPEPLLIATRELFAALKAAACARVLQDSTADKPEQGPSPSPNRPLSWQPVAEQDLPPTVVATVRKALDEYLSLRGLEEPAPAPRPVLIEAANEMIGPAPEPAARPVPAGRDRRQTTLDGWFKPSARRA